MFFRFKFQLYDVAGRAEGVVDREQAAEEAALAAGAAEAGEGGGAAGVSVEASAELEQQRAEVEALKDSFSSSVASVWQEVMSVEVTLVSQTEKVLSDFESNLGEMMGSFIGAVKELFARARSVDTRCVHKSLTPLSRFRKKSI